MTVSHTPKSDLEKEIDRLKRDLEIKIEQHVEDAELIQKLYGENKKLRAALESCIHGTYMWVITPESARDCQAGFEYIRNKATEALKCSTK